MSIITLVRHGQASAGTDNYDRLSDLGQQQSQLLGDWWVKTGMSPDAVFAGTLERQQHTASLTLERAGLNRLSVGTLPDLNEYAHNDIDREFGGGFSSDSGLDLTIKDYYGIMDRWRNAEDSELNGAESWQHFMSRGMAAMRQAHDAVGGTGHAVLFTSGGIIATLAANVQIHPFQVIIDNIWHIRNSSMTTVHFDGDSTQLLDFNGVPHLDCQANNTQLITQI